MTLFKLGIQPVANVDVKTGVKWAANFWFWNMPQTSSRTARRLVEDLQNRSMLRFERGMQ